MDEDNSNNNGEKNEKVPETKLELKKSKKKSSRKKHSSNSITPSNTDTTSSNRQERASRRKHDTESRQTSQINIQGNVVQDNVESTSSMPSTRRERGASRRKMATMKEPSSPSIIISGTSKKSNDGTEQDNKKGRSAREPPSFSSKQSLRSKDERYARKMASMGESSLKRSIDKVASQGMSSMNEPPTFQSTSSLSKENRYARKLAAMNESSTSTTSTAASRDARVTRKMASAHQEPSSTLQHHESSSTLEPITAAASASPSHTSNTSREDRMARKLQTMNESSSEGISNSKRKNKHKSSKSRDSSDKKLPSATHSMQDSSTSSIKEHDSSKSSMQVSGLSEESMAMRNRLREERQATAKQREAERRAAAAPRDDSSSLQDSSSTLASDTNITISQEFVTSTSDRSSSSRQQQRRRRRRPSGPNETRLPSAAPTSKRRSGDTDSEQAGAYRVESRAIGALPAWARSTPPTQSRQERQYNSDRDEDDLAFEPRQTSRHSSNQDAISDDNDVPPEMRHQSNLSTNRDNDDSDLPPEMRHVQEQVPMIHDDNDDGMITTAEVSYGDTTYESRMGKFGKSRRFWIVTIVSVLVAVGIAVGVGVGLSSRDSSGGSSDPCDFTNMEQPDVSVQCECNGEISTYSSTASARYQELLNSIVLNVNPRFNEEPSSCSPENAALAWLATDEYSSSTTDAVTLTNRYVLALLFQSWTGTDWTASTGWLSSTSECSWFGISCEGNAVVGLELGNNDLKSSTSENGLPVELFSLTSLSKWTRMVVTLSFLPHLTLVHFASFVESFNASSASLRGNIPSEIRSLTSLGTCLLLGFGSKEPII